jgi:hypothetical protein
VNVRFSSALLVVLSAFPTAPPVLAQAYVGVSLVGDVLRMDRYGSGGSSDDSGSGEAVGFALRVGVPVGRAWGVEAEFTRPSEIDTTYTPGIYPLAAIEAYTVAAAGAPQIVPELFPVVRYEVRSRRRTNTLATSVWVRHEVSDRVSLVYRGGVGFHRTAHEQEYRYDFGGLAPTPVRILPPPSSSSIIHTVHPLVGFEAQIAMSDRVDLVPGLQLHGVTGGWLFRPSVGLNWSF